jgi:hypothetical protein
MVIPGLLLSVALAAITFAVTPPVYTSSGEAVLVLPKQVGANQANANQTNPLINFDPSLSTTAEIMIDGLTSPAVESLINLAPGDSFTVTNTNDGGFQSANQSVNPFIYFKTQSTSPDRSVAMVSSLLDEGRQLLLDRQRALQVRPRNYVSLDSVIEATTPQIVSGSQLGWSEAALALGIAVTIAITWLAELLARRRDDKQQDATRAPNVSPAAEPRPQSALLDLPARSNGASFPSHN